MVRCGGRQVMTAMRPPIAAVSPRASPRPRQCEFVAVWNIGRKPLFGLLHCPLVGSGLLRASGAASPATITMTIN